MSGIMQWADFKPLLEEAVDNMADYSIGRGRYGARSGIECHGRHGVYEVAADALADASTST